MGEVRGMPLCIMADLSPSWQSFLCPGPLARLLRLQTSTQTGQPRSRQYKTISWSQNPLWLSDPVNVEVTDDDAPVIGLETRNLRPT
jgi:hypothetical protein